MSLLHPRRAAEADRSRIRSYDQVRATAAGRPHTSVLDLDGDRPRAAAPGGMRRRPATRAPRTIRTGARREVTINVVRGTEDTARAVADPGAELAELLALFVGALAGPGGDVVRMMLMPRAARVAELAAERRRLFTTELAEVWL